METQVMPYSLPSITTGSLITFSLSDITGTSFAFVDDTDSLKIEKIGPGFEKNEIFPDRVNTEFIQIIDRKTIKMRVWERGSGETLACGTGACASVVACVLNNLTDNKVTVKLLGGDLKIKYDTDENTVYMTGPARIAFTGNIDI